MVYLFDFDGTLVDSMPNFSKTMTRILDESVIEYGKDIVKIIVIEFRYNGHLFFLESGDHINAVLVTSAFKFGGKEDICKLKSNSCADGSCAHAKNVGVVMFSGEFGGKMVAAASRTDSFEFVCADAHADAGSANEDAKALVAFFGNRRADLFGKLGVMA